MLAIYRIQNFYIYYFSERSENVSITSDIIRGHTDSIILSHLVDKDSYGYEINKAIQETTDNKYELKEATLYTAFRRLEQAGMIESYWGDQTTGARRRYYSITELGRAALDQNRKDWNESKQIIDKLINGVIKMYENLRKRVDELFQNAPKTRRVNDFKEELMANLIDKYNDLTASGKSEEDAINETIDSVGDVDELIRGLKEPDIFNYKQMQKDREKSAVYKTAASAIYIMSVVVLILLGSVLG